MLTTPAVIRALRDAADALERGDHLRTACCGAPLDEATGACSHRPGHPTITSPNFLGYPGWYDTEGRYVPSRGPVICQVGDPSLPLSCPERESGGLRCEVDGDDHVHHWISEHTILHSLAGNGFACSAIAGGAPC